jgi:hypothetical protein
MAFSPFLKTASRTKELTGLADIWFLAHVVQNLNQTTGDCLSQCRFTIWAADVGMICFRSPKDEFG